MTTVVDVTCKYCALAFEVECEGPAASTSANVHALACPRCGAANDRALPGDVIEIWQPGERVADPDEASFLWPTRCPNAHDALLQFRPTTLRESMARGTLRFYCIRCNTTWPPSAAEERALIGKLAGERPS